MNTHKISLLAIIKKIDHPIFTTFEITRLSKKSTSTITQSLNILVKNGLIIKICRGIWAENNKQINPYALIPYLLARHRAYVSFISALHLYDIIEQIPQVITIASTSHTRTIHTKIGVFSFHQLSPKFFSGFNWYKGDGKFLIAEPEKAFIDSLYLSARKKNQFGNFPELHFSKTFSFKKAKQWAMRIPDRKIRKNVLNKLGKFVGQAWFWTKEWQEGEKEAEADIKAGRVKKAKTIKKLIKKLDR